VRNGLALCILFALASQPIAQTNSGAAFQLNIEAEAPSVASGGKIVLQIMLANISDSALVFGQRMRPDQAEWDYRIDVRNEKGEAVAETAYGRIRLEVVTLFSSQMKTVAPGHSLKEEVTLSKLYDLTIPGRYTVQVSRHAHDRDSGQLVTSNTATIIVTDY
jgi:hypothetical protein